MNKTSESPLDIDSTTWLESPFFQFLFRYQKQILSGAAILFFGLILIYQLTSQRSSNATHDYIVADQVFSSVIADENGINSLDRLAKLMERHPELHMKYDALIAQSLMNSGEIPAARSFADQSLIRTEEENNPYYSQFSKASLLIAENKYTEALQLADQLRKEMETVSFGPTLKVNNLLQIAALQKKLELKNEELSTLLTLKNFLNSKVFDKQMISLEESNINLLSYIQERIKQLQFNKQIAKQ